MKKRVLEYFDDGSAGSIADRLFRRGRSRERYWEKRLRHPPRTTANGRIRERGRKRKRQGPEKGYVLCIRET